MTKVMTINDLHFGIADTSRMYDELHIFKEKLQEYKPDILIFAGDYFDHKLSFTDTASYYAMMFFNEVINICRENHIIVRMLQGTRGHELNQLQAFKSHETDKDLDFKVIENLSEEKLLDVNILYIPEEYPDDRSYYEEYFSEHQHEYDLVSMHGTADVVERGEMMAAAVAGRSNVAPVFTKEELLGLLTDRGYVSSGHIHQRSNYKNKILYSGAYTRWRFDDTSDRGFTYFEFDENGSRFEFILNYEAPVYKTIRLDEEYEDANSVDIRELEKYISEKAEAYDYLKLDLAGLDKAKTGILKEHFSSYDNVKIEASKAKDAVVDGTVSEEQKAKFEKYKYITHPDTPLEERIKKYLHEEKKADVSLDVIKNILQKGE